MLLFLGRKGPPGEQGEQGPQGPPGIHGECQVMSEIHSLVDKAEYVLVYHLATTAKQVMWGAYHQSVNFGLKSNG